MRELTKKEAANHARAIKRFHSKLETAKDLWLAREITKKRYIAIVEKIEQQERDYLKQSGIFLFFGKLLKKEVVEA